LQAGFPGSVAPGDDMISGGMYMNRSVMLSTLLAVAAHSAALAENRVQVQGIFVRAYTGTEITEVNVDERVQLIVKVRDSSTSPHGVAGGLVDITWNSAILQLLDSIDTSAATTSDVSPLFANPPWTFGYSGVKLNLGSISGLGAGRSDAPTANQSDFVTYFTLTFKAIALGAASVALTPHDFGVIVTTPPATVQTYDTPLNPSLTVVSSGSNQEPPDDTPSGTCGAAAAPLGALLMAGAAGLMGNRRQRRRIG
jgi:hypothetical protein